MPWNSSGRAAADNASERKAVMYHVTRDATAMGYLATKPTMIITTTHASGVVNAGVFGAYTNLSPNQLGVAASTGSHTYANILRTGEFVINVPGADLVKALAVIAEEIPESRSEVEAAGLTLKDPVTCQTPSIAECQAAVECRFEKEVPIGRHSFLIARVTGGWVREAVRERDGGIDIFKARVLKDYKYPKPLYMLPGQVVEG
jgi:flavin reductase (DIM6/NTAB) family NADH-FMN oxidoreductase RutF